MTLPPENHGKVVAVAGNQSTTLDLLRRIVDAGYEVTYLINLDPSHRDGIADYMDLEPAAKELGIELLRPHTYHMKDDVTRELIQGRGIDLLIVIGWQRLIPPWFLQDLTIGAFGMHGSSEPLPRGRGRSPMNWSIIEGRDRFITCLFRYDEGVDSGKIVACQRFDIRPWDTIRSLQHKNQVAQTQLLLGHLPDLLTGDASLRDQRTDLEPTYYPKRVPADGVIDWRDTVNRIDRLVRAVTSPYPGAFTWDGDTQVMIWAGKPFDTQIRYPDAAPGEIVETFSDGSFVVRCLVDTYYVTEWEGPTGWRPDRGLTFRSKTNPSWDKLRSMHSTEDDGGDASP